MTGFTDREFLQPADKAERFKPIKMTLRILDDRRVKAVFVGDPNEMTVTAWLPRAEIKIEPAAGNRAIVTMPTWLAIDRGLAGVPGRGQKTLF